MSCASAVLANDLAGPKTETFSYQNLRLDPSVPAKNVCVQCLQFVVYYKYSEYSFDKSKYWLLKHILGVIVYRRGVSYVYANI
jgi:hypothetical protein